MASQEKSLILFYNCALYTELQMLYYHKLQTLSIWLIQNAKFKSPHPTLSIWLWLYTTNMQQQIQFEKNIMPN